ncbi:DUF5753 domain-containing protein [Micromonospora sp. NPDC003241]
MVGCAGTGRARVAASRRASRTTAASRPRLRTGRAGNTGSRSSRTADASRPALRRGAPEVMGPQLDHLISMAERPNVMVHIIPRTAGLHPGQAGPFVIATTADGDNVGYLDDQAQGRITNDVAPLWAVWDTVRSVALPRDQSIEFLRARAWLT